ncbi:MAG TPA: sigma-70 family RNA polymerase sigma factor [Acidobacteriota bacterium]|nr:sigma-70 family RNA polymerase sigma factor [Acidobacteriota bacterium]
MDQATSSLDLIDRIKRGDQDAFTHLFQKYRPRLAVLVHYRMGSHLRGLLEVDDMVQETFLEACRQLDHFAYRSPGSFFRWISRIAEHVIVDAARYEGRGKRDAGERVPLRSASHPEGLEPVDTRTPSRLLAEHEAVLLLMRKLDALPEQYREAILLAKVEGLTTAEMAERLGKTREATTLLLHRAIKQFRQIQEAGESR